MNEDVSPTKNSDVPGSHVTEGYSIDELVHNRCAWKDVSSWYSLLVVTSWFLFNVSSPQVPCHSDVSPSKWNDNMKFGHIAGPLLWRQVCGTGPGKDGKPYRILLPWHVHATFMECVRSTGSMWDRKMRWKCEKTWVQLYHEAGPWRLMTHWLKKFWENVLEMLFNGIGTRQ